MSVEQKDILPAGEFENAVEMQDIPDKDGVKKALSFMDRLYQVFQMSSKQRRAIVDLHRERFEKANGRGQPHVAEVIFQHVDNLSKAAEIVKGDVQE